MRLRFPAGGRCVTSGGESAGDQGTDLLKPKSTSRTVEYLRRRRSPLRSRTLCIFIHRHYILCAGPSPRGGYYGYVSLPSRCLASLAENGFSRRCPLGNL